MRPIDIDQLKTASETDRGGKRTASHVTVATASELLFDTAVRTSSPGTTHFNGFLNNKLLTALPGQEFARLLPHLEPVALVAGQELYEFGSPVNFVYFPETAVLSNVFFLEDGSSTGAAIIGNEGMVGLSAVLDARRLTYCPRVTIPGNALRVKLGVIKKEFVSGGAMQVLLHTYTTQRLAELSQRVACNGRHNLGERLCTWLLMVRDRTPLERLPLTHEEIASHLGTRRAGVTGACNALRYSGIIDYRRGQIRIIDRTRLETAACECYRALPH